MSNSAYSILAVDDSPSMRSMISYTIKEAGYNCEVAENGLEAVNAAEKTKYDLVLMDINMPVMNGIEAIKELRKREDYAHSPIIVLSTESRDDIKQKGREAGATGWIVKPFDPEKLVTALRRVLQ